MTFSEYSASVRSQIAEAIVAALHEHESQLASFSGDSTRTMAILQDYALNVRCCAAFSPASGTTFSAPIFQATAFQATPY